MTTTRRSRLGLGWAMAITTLASAGCAGVGDARGERASVERARSGISLGDHADPSEFPATAALRFGDITQGATCSGTLVGKTWVLTAAHCVKNVGTEEAAKWKVFFGAADLADDDGEEFGVKAVRTHPDWNPTAIRLGFGDVALLELDREVKGIQPVVLHRSKVPVGASLQLVGYGKAVEKATSADELSGILRAGENETISCASVPSDASRPKIQDERSLCFETEDAPGPCQRDSGGPAYIEVDGALQVAGVVSGGRDTAIGACGRFAVYSAVNAELAFLEQFLGAPGADGAGAPSDLPPGQAADATQTPAGGAAVGAADTPAPAADEKGGCSVGRVGARSGPASALAMVVAALAFVRGRRGRRRAAVG